MPSVIEAVTWLVMIGICAEAFIYLCALPLAALKLVLTAGETK